MSMPTTVPPPGRLSTMTDFPQRSVSFWAPRRVMVSRPPPGAIPITTRTGLRGKSLGFSCAQAAAAVHARKKNPARAGFRARASTLRPEPVLPSRPFPALPADRPLSFRFRLRELGFLQFLFHLLDATDPGKAFVVLEAHGAPPSQ
jgi:hypothetical protein